MKSFDQQTLIIVILVGDIRVEKRITINLKI